MMIKKILAAGTIFSCLLATEKKQAECCGIVGIVMKTPITKQDQAKFTDKNYRYSAEQFLCQGVELLKNRGYDSAGVFTLSNNIPNSGKLIKYADHGLSEISCITRVVQEVLSETGIATSGIAHTRWATCGQKVDKNSHPHCDESKQIHLVHNGIIINHAWIRNTYLSDIKFTSQTDTEVIVQFLGLRRRQGKTMVEALTEFSKIAEKKSQWGLVIIDKESPDVIYTSTNGSPLLIGFSKQEDEIFVVSEKIAFEKHANCFFESKDNQIFELKVSQVAQLKQNLKQRLIFITDPPAVLKQAPPPYKYFYSYQIRQQISIPFKPNFERVKALQFGNYLTIIACGSSYYAAMASEYFFKKLRCFKKLHVVDPVELDHNDITQDETVLLVSQSGQTKDLIQIVADCNKKEKVKTIGIINVEGSTLARKVDFPIYIKVGRETCVAATKSFFHQVLNIIQFATEVAQKKQSAPIQLINQIRAQLLTAPDLVEQVIKNNEQKCIELANILIDKKSIYLLGKRQSLAIAKEAALKIKQLTYIHAEALGACQMKHGPIAMIQSRKKQETTVFLFVLNNETYPTMMNLVDQMHSRNAQIVLITDCLDLIEEQYLKQVEKCKAENKAIPERKYHFVLTVPPTKHISHLLSIVAIQLFVEKMCFLKIRVGDEKKEIHEVNPDFPRNLAKSVTV